MHYRGLVLGYQLSELQLEAAKEVMANQDTVITSMRVAMTYKDIDLKNKDQRIAGLNRKITWLRWRGFVFTGGAAWLGYEIGSGNAGRVASRWFK